MANSYRLDTRELKELHESGFVLRDGGFDTRELHAIVGACETLVEDLVAAKRRTKRVVGSYMCELQRELGTVVKWEPTNPTSYRASSYSPI